LHDFLEILARDAKETVSSGYYNVEKTHAYSSPGLRESILKCRTNPIIAEIKTASPSKGKIVQDIDVETVASMMQRGGAAALSVLTEPRHFKGRMEYFVAANTSGLPRLMKDIIVDPVQVEAATKLGASAILLIGSLFNRGLCDTPLDEMISLAHKGGIEVLLETHTKEEFERALHTQADLVGINNRDLSNFRTDLQVTRSILDFCDPNGRVVVSESGIESEEHIRFLRESGARAFLVGSSVMSATDPERKVRELAGA
jgi:indole-3-glycerol phosphate synthase